MVSVLKYGYEALQEFGISQPAANSNGKTEVHKIIPISYYVLTSCALVGAIIAIAGYILTQLPLLVLGIGFSLISSLGAYEIKRLALTKEFEDQVHDFTTLIDLFKAQIKRLSGEKNDLDVSLKKFQTEINDLSTENKKIHDLTEELKKTDVLTTAEISRLEVQGKELKAIKEGLEKQLDILVKAKKDLEDDLISQKNSLDQFGVENKKLSENITELKANQELLKTKINTFSDENKNLQGLISEGKSSISNIKQETDRIQKQAEDLEKAVELLRKAHQTLKKDTKEKEQVSHKLDLTVEALGEKVNKKLAKIIQLKSDYEKKLKEQEDKFNLIKLENELLKSENIKLKNNISRPLSIPIAIHPEYSSSEHTPRGSRSPSMLPKALHHTHHEIKEKINGTS